MLHKVIAWGTLVLLAGGLLAFALFRPQISTVAQLVKVYLTARSFQARYPHLARDLVYDPNVEPRLDVYWPDSPGPHPVLVFVHGGSWKDYDKNLFAPVALKLVPRGFVVVIPDYTLYPDATYHQMATEVAAALNWTLENIESYGGDPARVVVSGHSAGAHLTSLALLDSRYLVPYGRQATDFCGLVGMSGVYDVQAEYDYWAARGPAPVLIARVMGGTQNLAQASPITYVRSDLPPVLLIHGSQDETVPASIASEFQAALQAAGAESQLILYPGAGHSDYLLAALSQQDAPLVSDLTAFVEGCSALPGGGRDGQ